MIPKVSAFVKMIMYFGIPIPRSGKRSEAMRPLISPECQERTAGLPRPFSMAGQAKTDTPKGFASNNHVERARADVEVDG